MCLSAWFFVFTLLQSVLQQLIVAARLSDNFSQDVDPRLLRHMNSIYVDEVTQQDLQEMVTNSLERHFSEEYSNTVSKLAKVIRK